MLPQHAKRCWQNPRFWGACSNWPLGCATSHPTLRGKELQGCGKHAAAVSAASPARMLRVQAARLPPCRPPLLPIFLQAERVMCQLREENKTDLQRYSILNQLLSSNQTLYYKAGRPPQPVPLPVPCRPRPSRIF